MGPFTFGAWPQSQEVQVAMQSATAYKRCSGAQYEDAARALPLDPYADHTVSSHSSVGANSASRAA